MRRVIIESPYAGDVERNLRYLRACMRDCLKRGEAPFASHGLYTQPGVLRDEVLEERKLGIEAGFYWGAMAAACIVYCDLGFSKGMLAGIERAERMSQPIEHRMLGEGWDCYGRVEGCPRCAELPEGAPGGHWDRSKGGIIAHDHFPVRVDSKP